MCGAREQQAQQEESHMVTALGGRLLRLLWVLLLQNLKLRVLPMWAPMLCTPMLSP